MCWASSIWDTAENKEHRTPALRELNSSRVLQELSWHLNICEALLIFQSIPIASHIPNRRLWQANGPHTAGILSRVQMEPWAILWEAPAVLASQVFQLIFMDLPFNNIT